MLRIRAFKAVDDPESCRKFAEGHAKVLLDYGVNKITSAGTTWQHNPSVYVLIAERGDEVVGGVRVHVADGITRLPMEDAISMVDIGVFDLIKRYIPIGTGELCGLWNAKSVAGMGLGSYFLMRAGISITSRIRLPTLFALCAPHTFTISVEKGFEVEDSIGNSGTFIYPKLDLVATSILIKDTQHLPKALPQEREIMLQLREAETITRVETNAKSETEIFYDFREIMRLNY